MMKNYMKIPNLKNKSLDEVKRALSDRYPYSVIEEPFLLMPLRLIVAKSNFEFKIMKKEERNYFKVDCIPSWTWRIGAALLNLLTLVFFIFSVLCYFSFVMPYFSAPSWIWIVLWGGICSLWIYINPGLFLTKAIFRTLYLQKFERFYEDIQRAANK
jgi:hypothetical protein